MGKRKLDQCIGASTPILYVRRSHRLINMRRQEDGSSKGTIDLTNVQYGDSDSDFVSDVRKAGTQECDRSMKKRKIRDVGCSVRRVSVRKMQNEKRKCPVKKAADKQGPVVGISKFFTVAGLKSCDADKPKRGMGKRRLVSPEKKGKGKVTDGEPRKGNVVDDQRTTRSGCKKNMLGKKNKGKNVEVDNGKGSGENIDCDGLAKKGRRGCNKRKADVPVVTKPGFEKIHLRIALWSLQRLLPNLTVRQKADVTSMGFGSVLGFKIKDVPKHLGYWLLDKFDEDQRVLRFHGKTIRITRDSIKDILGLPMGDVVLDVRDEADFRHPMVISWKAQFGKKERYLHIPVEEMIYTQRDGGWMFMLNFLVLYFTTIGESNMNATVNLRYLHCITDVNVIPSFDWCSYVLECLVKTKKNWTRSSHYQGPVIVLLILYAHAMKPMAEDEEADGPLVNKWSDDSLNTLEEEWMRSEVIIGTLSIVYQ